jgi:hypothetical protein
MFQAPAILLSVILASLAASLFQAWKGRAVMELALFELASLLGFALGQVVAVLAGWQFLTIGQVHPVEGLAGSLLGLALVRWLKG